MGMTSVYLPDDVQALLRERGMTLRGVIQLGIEASKHRLESNEIMLELQKENQELKRRIERLALIYAGGQNEITKSI